MHRFGGEWSESKLDCVERYTQAYLRVMQNQTWCELHYIDAFAGRGKQVVKSSASTTGEFLEHESFFGDDSERADAETFLRGSALRALDASRAADRPFDHFTLIDAHRPSCEELRSAIDTGFPEMHGLVDILCDDANSALARHVDSIDWSTARALVFLDPYGLEVSWECIEGLANTGACDVWYLFPLGGVIRMMAKNGRIPDAWCMRLDLLFGTHAWYDEFYAPTNQLSLFGDDQDRVRKEASTHHVVEFVRRRLTDAFPAVSEAGILRNRKGAPLFALVLGVSNPEKPAQAAALRIANHLVKGL
jgi:three-Cys-motif partner protein